ncbi:hypothetical protein T484DRAFT_1833174, partial [Baffinella frigidus]
DGNKIGPEGAKALAVALSSMPNLIALSLKGNAIGPEGAKALAGALSSMPNLTALDLGSCDLGPEGAKALAGALSSMPNLTELDLGVNAAEVDWKVVTGFTIPSEVVERGKTSVVRAMQSESGTTETIQLDDRTIAIDVGRHWKIEGVGGPLVLETWDFGGQPEYHTSHSSFLSARCLTALVYRPTGNDGQYYTAEQLMRDFLRTWLQMLHS